MSLDLYISESSLVIGTFPMVFLKKTSSIVEGLMERKAGKSNKSFPKRQGCVGYLEGKQEVIRVVLIISVVLQLRTYFEEGKQSVALKASRHLMLKFESRPIVVCWRGRSIGFTPIGSTLVFLLEPYQEPAIRGGPRVWMDS